MYILCNVQYTAVVGTRDLKLYYYGVLRSTEVRRTSDPDSVSTSSLRRCIHVSSGWKSRNVLVRPCLELLFVDIPGKKVSTIVKLSATWVDWYSVGWSQKGKQKAPCRYCCSRLEMKMRLVSSTLLIHFSCFCAVRAFLPTATINNKLNCRCAFLNSVSPLLKAKSRKRRWSIPALSATRDGINEVRDDDSGILPASIAVGAVTAAMGIL